MKDVMYVTTQLTAKRFKLQSLLSVLMILVGLSMVIHGSGAEADQSMVVWGCLLVLVGFVWRVVNRVRIWWNHE